MKKFIIVNDQIIWLPKKPKCVDTDREWAEWIKYAFIGKTSFRTYCLDCSMDYQDDMIKADRCQFPNFKTKDIFHKYNKKGERYK